MQPEHRSGSRAQSFKHAFAGWWHVIRTQQNAWIHAFATLVVVALGWYLQLDWGQWADIVLAIGLVWLAEFLNTALEAVVDLASPTQHPLAKVGKDVGAAGVLIAAVVAALVGFTVLGPPLLERLFGS